MQLQIETTSFCNAHCLFCVHPHLEREKGTMSMQLFKKIIDEATGISIIDHVTLNGLGEPLLDKQLCDRVRYTRRAMNGVTIDIYTNGSLLTKPICDSLKSSGISRVFVSLNAVRSTTRLEIMGVDDYDHVVSMIHYLRSIGVPIKVLVTASKDLIEQSDVTTLCSEFGPDAMPHLEGNWAGKLYMPRIRQHNACGRALGQIMILWDGRVCICCQDSEGNVIFGDTNKQTLREVYESAEYQRYRQYHVEGKRSQLLLCSDCTSN